MARFFDKLRKKTAEAGEGEFEVALTGMAHMNGSIKVMAKDSKEAMERAKDQHGEVDWKYEGMDEKSIQAEVKSPVSEPSMDMPPMEELPPEISDEVPPEAGAEGMSEEPMLEPAPEAASPLE